MVGVASTERQDSCSLPTEVTFPELRWHPHSSPRNARSGKGQYQSQTGRVSASKRRARFEFFPTHPVVDRPDDARCSSSNPPITGFDDALSSTGSSVSQDQQPEESGSSTQDEQCNRDLEMSPRSNLEREPNQEVIHPHGVAPWIAPLAPETRRLLYHCKQEIFNSQ